MTSDPWTQASDPSARGSRDPSFGGQEMSLSYVLQSQGQAVGAESLERGGRTARLVHRLCVGSTEQQPHGRDALTDVRQKELVRTITESHGLPAVCNGRLGRAGRAGGRGDMEN